MKRRQSAVPMVDAIPEELRSMAGVRDFIEPAPVGDPFKVYLRAFQRWLGARKRWCAERGLDYVDTFHPDWRRPQ